MEPRICNAQFKAFDAHPKSRIFMTFWEKPKLQKVAILSTKDAEIVSFIMSVWVPNTNLVSSICIIFFLKNGRPWSSELYPSKMPRQPHSYRFNWCVKFPQKFGQIFIFDSFSDVLSFQGNTGTSKKRLIVIEGWSCLRSVYGPHMDFICGGQYQEFRASIRRFVNTFQQVVSS